MEAKSEKMFIEELGQELEITGLTFPQLMEFVQFSMNKDSMGAANFIVFTILRSNTPTKEVSVEEGMTDDEIREILPRLAGFTPLMIVKKVQEMSGLASEDDIKKLQEKMEREGKQPLSPKE